MSSKLRNVSRDLWNSYRLCIAIILLMSQYSRSLEQTRSMFIRECRKTAPYLAHVMKKTIQTHQMKEEKYHFIPSYTRISHSLKRLIENACNDNMSFAVDNFFRNTIIPTKPCPSKWIFRLILYISLCISDRAIFRWVIKGVTNGAQFIGMLNGKQMSV